MKRIIQTTLISYVYLAPGYHRSEGPAQKTSGIIHWLLSQFLYVRLIGANHGDFELGNSKCGIEEPCIIARFDRFIAITVDHIMVLVELHNSPSQSPQLDPGGGQLFAGRKTTPLSFAVVSYLTPQPANTHGLDQTHGARSVEDCRNVYLRLRLVQLTVLAGSSSQSPPRGRGP